ncbi:MAG: DNA polymerase III subunit delta [Oscillibacter sp.]|jgi:DNA polymerase-3 subunit delta|nr:DNA polymerase III subunit delta [Oscillibacter sp.]
MAYEKKKTGQDAGLQRLKSDLQSGTLKNAYIFYGEESYLREYYLHQIKSTLIPAACEEFNCHILDGRTLTAQALLEMAEAMPMMAEHTLIAAEDFDLFRLPEEQREKLILLLEDLPPYCCLIFVYDTVEYKPNRTVKKLCAAIDRHVECVEFRVQDNSNLVPWVIRHFKSLDRNIDRQTAEYLIFTCGSLMTGLMPEIQKIAAYTRGKTVTAKEIDAVADPVLSAEMFRFTDAVVQGNYDGAAVLMAELLTMQTDPLKITAALGMQLRHIYTARLAIDAGKDRYWLMELWQPRSDYSVRLWMRAAEKTTTQWCADAVKQCQVLDRRLKSQRGADGAQELKLLLVRLGAQRP